MKSRTLFVSAIVLAVLGTGSILWPMRLRIAAAIWHWKHGNYVQVGVYEIPVPRSWLVRPQPRGGSLIIDTKPDKQPGVALRSVVISADVLPISAVDLDFWKTNKRAWLKKNGLDNPDELTLSFTDETIVCVGGHEFSNLMQLPGTGEAISMDCRSSKQLHLTFTGPQRDLGLFYSLIPRIQKRN